MTAANATTRAMPVKAAQGHADACKVAMAIAGGLFRRMAQNRARGQIDV